MVSQRKKHWIYLQGVYKPKARRDSKWGFFTNQEAIQRATYIKESFEKQQALGCSGFSDAKYRFIDEPIYKDALLLLKQNA